MTQQDTLSLIRAALAGAETFVWEWDIDSDRLVDMDEGLAQLGYARGEVGSTQQDWDRLIHPEDLAANEAAYQRHVRGEVEVFEHAYRIRARDGRWRWTMERGRIVERHADGRPRRMVGTQTDITERRAAEEAALEAQGRLERIARHTPGLLYQFEMSPDLSSRFSFVSERVTEVFGISAEQATSDARAIWNAIDPQDKEQVIATVLDSAASLAEWRSEFRVVRPDGSTRWMLGSSSPQRLADGRTVWHGYIQDVTEGRELEQARRDAAVAAAANRAKSGFLSRMSHELRTPLNAVLGFAQLMEIDRAEPAAPGQKRRLALIREAGEHLLHMIGDLLDLTRIESGGMALALEAVTLHELAAQVMEMMRAAAEQAQVSLTLAPGGADIVVRADRTRLRQVLINLLSNAIKYNRPGGRVELSVARGDDGTAVLTVSDSGLGIAEADLPHIFEPFQRGRQAGGTIDGAGIGLSVTQALVALMDGQVSASSAAGEGSTFRVSLPVYSST